jgi:hypothetical protein
LKAATDIRACRWALTRHERLRLRAINEAAIAYLFELDRLDLKQILADCDYPPERIAVKEFSRSLDSKGFWRVEKDQFPEHRLPVLAQIAFRDLAEKGLEAFLAQNDGEGWLIPETLRLTDHGLGHDDRANEHQPVAWALGPRFYPWQLDQSAEESWEECERHAEVLAKILPPPDSEDKIHDDAGDRPVDLFGVPIDTDLFGDPVYTKSRRR